MDKLIRDFENTKYFGYMFFVEYDGQKFESFDENPNKKSVKSEFRKILENNKIKIFKGIQQAGRTDANVSAKENILYIAPPSLSFPGDRYYEAFSTLDGEWNRELEDFCKEEGILCFSPFSLELPRFPDRVHLLPEGQIKLGEALLQFIEEKQFLKS